MSEKRREVVKCQYIADSHEVRVTMGTLTIQSLNERVLITFNVVEYIIINS